MSKLTLQFQAFRSTLNIFMNIKKKLNYFEMSKLLQTIMDQ